jgi:unsaturated rhamnogalacturonyl hydrolase
MTAFVPLLIGALLFAGFASAQSTPTQIHTSPQQNPGVYSGRLKVDYPTPYELASEEAVRKTLEQVHAYVDQAAPVQVIDDETGAPVADLTRLPAKAVLARTDMQILTYEWGVTYAGMLRSAQVTGDRRYTGYTQERVSAIATLAAHAKKNLPPGTTHANYPMPKNGLGFRSILLPGRLDDSGAMCAALIKAHVAGLGDGTLKPWIDNYVQYVSTKQFRLRDGTLARNRPLPNSLWLDDLYMSVPCLAQAGKLTGERRYYDDAARQILQFAERMFVEDKGLFMHAWVQDMKHHPAFHWARANGWAIMATVEL